MTANLDLVRSIYADFERGDFGHADRTHPEIEYVNVGGPTPGSRKGLTGMAEGSRDFLSAWEDYRAEPEEFRDIDGERILVLLHHRGRGKTSGLELGQMQQKIAALSQCRHEAGLMHATEILGGQQHAGVTRMQRKGQHLLANRRDL